VWWYVPIVLAIPGDNLSPRVQDQPSQYSETPPQKKVIYFWNFPFNIIELQLTKVTEATENKIMDKGNHCILYSI
jgi:predicted transposase YdaD